MAEETAGRDARCPCGFVAVRASARMVGVITLLFFWGIFLWVAIRLHTRGMPIWWAALMLPGAVFVTWRVIRGWIEDKGTIQLEVRPDGIVDHGRAEPTLMTWESLREVRDCEAYMVLEFGGESVRIPRYVRQYGEIKAFAESFL